MSVNPLETYLTELREIRDSGAATKETSGYGTLANLLNAVGHSLKPKVHCLIQLKNSGAGLPDGGLFTPDQLKNADEEALRQVWRMQLNEGWPHSTRASNISEDESCHRREDACQVG
jgi:hypothetical protein